MSNPGQWAGGFQAWDAPRRLPGHGARGAPGPAAAGARRGARRGGPATGSRSGSTSSRGWSTPCAASRPRPGSASRWSPSAPWPPGSPTRSTTRPRPRPAPSTPSTGPPTALAPSLRRLAESRHDRRSSSSMLDTLRRAVGDRPRQQLDARRPWPTGRRSWPSWLVGHDVDRDWVIAPPFAAAGADVAGVRAGGDAGCTPGQLDAGAGVDGQLAHRRRRCSARSARRPTGSPSWSPRCAPTPSSTAPWCSRPTSPRGWRAPW